MIEVSRSRRATRYFCAAAALSGLALWSPIARACAGDETEVYKSAKSAWCVKNSLVTDHGAFPTAFFKYGDDVIDELVAVFNVPAEGLYTYEAAAETGSAHTGSECCGLGVTVTGDAFYNNGYGATGYWGYLLSLHEMINDWTGQVSGGWPTDFWADHVSAFPNSLDWHIMQTLGTKNNDNNLSKAAVGQKGRFYPGGDSVDARVGMFDDIFDLPNFGFVGYSRVFKYVEGDKMSWDGLGVPNADVKRTEYVIAYLSLGALKGVTAIMKAAHVGDGTASGHGDAGYMVNQQNIDAIANAHCAIAAAGAQGQNVTAAQQSLRKGNYAAVTLTGTCGQGCPSECACDMQANKCVAPWLGTLQNGGGSGGAGGGSGVAGNPAAGAASGGTGQAGAATGGTSTGSPTAGGVTSSGGAPGNGSGGTLGTSTPGAGTATGGTSGAADTPGADSGCSCRVAGGRSASALLGGLLAALGLISLRARRR
jgi:hypothetical protein